MGFTIIVLPCRARPLLPAKRPVPDVSMAFR